MTAPPRGPRALLRLLARIVPSDERSEWLEEWEAELEALSRTNEAARTTGARPGERSVPSPWRFVAGALPHALWLRRERLHLRGAVQDLRFGARILRRAPGFTLAMAVTLALGIGTNASLFSLVDGIALRPPSGVDRPDRLVQIARSYDDAPRWDNWSWPAFREIARADDVFAGVAGYRSASLLVGEGASLETVSGLYVTGRYFDLLGIRPTTGRLLQPADDAAPDGPAVAVLGYDLWQRRFGARPGVVGETVVVGGRPHRVVGVAPADFAGVETFASEPEIFLPTGLLEHTGVADPLSRWGYSWLNTFGRLTPGVTVDDARTAVEAVSARMRAASIENEGVEVLLASGVGASPEERTEAATVSKLLMFVGLLVLLLTCANAASLFLARATARSPELSVRLALGAGRSRISRQLAVEAGLLAGLASVVSIPLLGISGQLLPGLLPSPVSVDFGVDARAVLAVFGVGLVAALLFGALPATLVARRRLGGTQRPTARSGSARNARLRDGLVVAQLAVSLALLAGAGMLGRSVLAASAADPGFEPRGLLVGYVDATRTGRYDPAAARELYSRLAESVRGLPGVTGVALASQAPFVGPFTRRGQLPADRPPSDELVVEAEAYFVGPGYFELLGIPLVAGRAVGGPEDTGREVAVVDRTLAEAFWPGEDPVGRSLRGIEGPVRIVGVVDEIRTRSLRGPARPTIYRPFERTLSAGAMLHVRTDGAPLDQVAPVRGRLAELAPGVPMAATADLHRAMVTSLGETRTFGTLVGLLAGMAFVLAVVGLYAVVTYGVNRRTRELGIRLALGAAPGRIQRAVVNRGLALAAVGVVAGLGLALLLGRALQGFLFAVEPASSTVLAAAAVLLLGVSALASWIPARRASRVDATTSLRMEDTP